MEINDLNQAIAVMNQIEDRRDLLRARYEEQDTRLRNSRDQLELFMLEKMKELNCKTFSVPSQGTINVKVKRRFGAADWAIVWDWIITNKCPEFLQKRLLDSEIQKYLEAKGELPPGVNSEAKNVITITGRG